jgi:hypothetical protein
MSLRGTREEHAQRAVGLLEKAEHHAEAALRKFEKWNVAGWHDYSVALIAWGSYLAESRWSGRLRDEERVEALLKRGERKMKGLLEGSL